jgi:DNA-binding transcriptional regulator YiaG
MLSRSAFAAQSGLDASLLRSYECARSQLNYGAAFKVIVAFGINPEWLATGKGRWWLSVPIPSPKELGVGARTPYSKIYEKYLAKTVAESTEIWKSRPPPDPLPLRINAAEPRERLMAEAQMVNWIKRLILCLPDSSLEAFLNFLYLEGTKRARSFPPDTKDLFEKRVAAMDFARAHLEALKKSAPDEYPSIATPVNAPVGPCRKKDLTNKVDSLTSNDVKPVLPKLIQRLKDGTKERGRKLELAMWLGVHRQCVTDWLSGKQEPGGEIALRLLHWVEQQERQK